MPGDQVGQSGDGGLLPPGLPIGTVVQRRRGGYRVALLADAAVQRGCRGPELLQAAGSSRPPPPQLPAEAAGLPAASRRRRPRRAGRARCRRLATGPSPSPSPRAKPPAAAASRSPPSRRRPDDTGNERWAAMDRAGNCHGGRLLSALVPLLLRPLGRADLQHAGLADRRAGAAAAAGA